MLFPLLIRELKKTLFWSIRGWGGRGSREEHSLPQVCKNFQRPQNSFHTQPEIDTVYWVGCRDQSASEKSAQEVEQHATSLLLSAPLAWGLSVPRTLSSLPHTPYAVSLYPACPTWLALQKQQQQRITREEEEKRIVANENKIYKFHSWNFATSTHTRTHRARENEDADWKLRNFSPLSSTISLSCSLPPFALSFCVRVRARVHVCVWRSLCSGTCGALCSCEGIAGYIS